MRERIKKLRKRGILLSSLRRLLQTGSHDSSLHHIPMLKEPLTCVKEVCDVWEGRMVDTGLVRHSFCTRLVRYGLGTGLVRHSLSTRLVRYGLGTGLVRHSLGTRLVRYGLGTGLVRHSLGTCCVG